MCQSKSAAPPASAGAVDDAGGSATAVGTSEAPRRGRVPLTRVRDARAAAAEGEARRAVARAAPSARRGWALRSCAKRVRSFAKRADAVAGDAVGAARVSGDILCGWSAV